MSQNSPCINHLAFADDGLLFIRNKKKDTEVVHTILHDFEGVSGQKVNLTKSLLYFSPNTLNRHRSKLSDIFGNACGGGDGDLPWFTFGG